MLYNKITLKLSHPSLNFTKGRGTQRPHTIIIHIAEGTFEGTTRWLRDPSAGVSAHYLIGRNGQTRSFVDEKNTAWHAGRADKKPLWRLAPGDNINCNTITIGIENEGYSTSVWTKAQKEANVKLIAEICKRWSINPDRDHIIGHYEISKTRRPNCPAVNKKILDEIVEMARAKLYVS